ncbi:MAG: hypothetical protein JHC31_15470 [Sulfurihydrogenibium sp.]|jgi:hypothetical protein|nr:hypothetical protein [Sulfurihydrogenibium sp.]MBX0313137.1 hypothetical protein [Sulfurihydrogenibium sp.]
MWLLLSLLLTGWGFTAYSGEAALKIPFSTKQQLANDVFRVVKPPERINYSEVKPTISNSISLIEKMKSARYVIEPVLASRGNFYVLAASVLGSAFFDYLINYLNDEVNQYYQTIPPPDCTYLVGYGTYEVKTVCNGVGGDFNSQSVDINTVVGWTNQGDGGCFPRFAQKTVWLQPGECIDIAYGGDFFAPWRGYYRPGSAPSDWLSLPGQPPKTDYPPLEIPMPTPADIQDHLPTGDFTASVPFPDSSDVRTPQDIKPPLSSPDGSVLYDIKNYSPDNVYSPDVNNPKNYVPDIPVNDDKASINYHLTDPNTGKSYDYNDKPSASSNPTTNPNNNPNTDYSYNPTNPDLDTDIKAPEKKDLKGLILSQISTIKAKFSFDNSCSGGACSFNVDIFGHTAIIDFCQFADLFSEIGTIILVFSYFYAFFIVVRGN